MSGSVGLVGLGLGAAFGGIALSDKSSAQAACPGTLCQTPDGVSKWSGAATSANVATAGFVIGGVGLVGAALLWFTAPKGRDRPRRSGLARKSANQGELVMRGLVVAIAGVGAVLLVGCEAILGISEHGLAPDAGEGRDGSSLRKEGGTDGGTDATTAHDGGHDATTKGKDGGRDGAHPADAAMDAPPPVFSRTKPTLAHPTLLLSITASDAGSGTFANPISLMLGPQINPVVVAQVQTQNGSSQQPIMAFELNGDSTVASSSFLGLAPIGVQLLEAHAGRAAPSRC